MADTIEYQNIKIALALGVIEPQQAIALMNQLRASELEKIRERVQLQNLLTWLDSQPENKSIKAA